MQDAMSERQKAEKKYIDSGYQIVKEDKENQITLLLRRVDTFNLIVAFQGQDESPVFILKIKEKGTEKSISYLYDWYEEELKKMGIHK